MQAPSGTKRVNRWYLLPGLFALAAVSVSAVAIQTVLFATGFQRQSTEEAASPQQSQSKPDTKEGIGFKLRLISDGLLCPLNNLECEDQDIRWKNFALQASDGHTLHVLSIPFPTAERSKKHFRALIKDAEKILRDNPESSDNGEPVGERARASFKAAKDKKRSETALYRLFWTRDKNYWELSGEHLEDVLALESRLREEGMRAIWSWR